MISCLIRLRTLCHENVNSIVIDSTMAMSANVSSIPFGSGPKQIV